MTESEPWRTLGRDYATSLRIVSDPVKEAYVAASARGQGLGTRLVAFAETRIFRESPNVFMTVLSFNTGAQRLYERLGYQRVGELTDYLVAGHAEILLRKTLGPLSAFQPGQATAKP